jgi:hypothetical protein
VVAVGDPMLVNEWIAEVIQQRLAAEHKLRELRAADQRDLDPTQIRALQYQKLGISGVYQPVSRMVTVTADPGVRRRSVRVGGADATIGLRILTNSFALDHGTPLPRSRCAMQR